MSLTSIQNEIEVLWGWFVGNKLYKSLPAIFSELENSHAERDFHFYMYI